MKPLALATFCALFFQDPFFKKQEAICPGTKSTSLPPLFSHFPPTTHPCLLLQGTRISLCIPRLSGRTMQRELQYVVVCTMMYVLGCIPFNQSSYVKHKDNCILACPVSLRYLPLNEEAFKESHGVRQ